MSTALIMAIIRGYGYHLLYRQLACDYITRTTDRRGKVVNKEMT